METKILLCTNTYFALTIHLLITCFISTTYIVFSYLHYAYTFYCNNTVYSTTVACFRVCTKSLNQIPINVYPVHLRGK